MNEQMERTLLETKVNALIERLHEMGHGVKDTSPNQDGTLSHYSLSDLRRLERELRDLMRTLGGSRQ